MKKKTVNSAVMRLLKILNNYLNFRMTILRERKQLLNPFQNCIFNEYSAD